MKLIDADRLIDDIKFTGIPSVDFYLEKVIDTINHAPEVEAIPKDIHDTMIRHTTQELQICQANLRPAGKWVEYEDERWGGVTVYCSECKANATYANRTGLYYQYKTNYCPECGAKML